MKNGEERFGILTAMENEVRLLLSKTEIERTDRIGGVNFHTGTLSGRKVVIAQAGIGKALSAAGASTMLNQYNVKALIFTGGAGGVGDETRVLDLVIGTELVQYDYGIRNQDGFHWSPPLFSSDTGHFLCDAELADMAWNAAVWVRRPGAYVPGSDRLRRSVCRVRVLCPGAAGYFRRGGLRDGGRRGCLRLRTVRGSLRGDPLHVGQGGREGA